MNSKDVGYWLSLYDTCYTKLSKLGPISKPDKLIIFYNNVLSSSFNLVISKSVFCDKAKTGLAMYKNKDSDFDCLVLSRVLNDNLVAIGFYEKRFFYGGYCPSRLSRVLLEDINEFFANNQTANNLKERSKMDTYDFLKSVIGLQEIIQRSKREFLLVLTQFSNWRETVNNLFFPEELTAINELSNLLF